MHTIFEKEGGSGKVNIEVDKKCTCLFFVENVAHDHSNPAWISDACLLPVADALIKSAIAKGMDVTKIKNLLNAIE